MVCLGNICRSPLAQGMLQQMADEDKLGWQVDSAGTADWQVGKSPDHRSVAVAKKMGYDISKQRARHFIPSFFKEYDHILVMDKSNLEDVRAFAETTRSQEVVRLFLRDGEVVDPYYDDALFEPVSLQIEKRCKELLKELR